MQSKFFLDKPSYYNLLTEREHKKVHVLIHKVLIFLKKLPLKSISKNSLQISSLDNTLLGNFTSLNSIILEKDLIRWTRDLEIISIDHYLGDIGGKNITGKY